MALWWVPWGKPAISAAVIGGLFFLFRRSNVPWVALARQ
jgi:hypothetical protein